MNATRMILVAIAAAETFGASASDFSDATVSDDASLNRSMAQYRRPFVAEEVWATPCLPKATAADASAVAQASESADEVLARILAQYGRAALDRGGWENPFAPGAAAGNPLLGVAPGDGVTTGPEAQAVTAIEPSQNVKKARR